MIGSILTQVGAEVVLEVTEPSPSNGGGDLAGGRAGYGRWAESSWAEFNVVGQLFYPIRPEVERRIYPGRY